jgi:hypothetical protein
VSQAVHHQVWKEAHKVHLRVSQAVHHQVWKEAHKVHHQVKENLAEWMHLTVL